jgi:hypothetical protein
VNAAPPETRQGRQRGGKAFSKASLHHLLTTSCTRARSVTRRKAGARDAEDAGVNSVGTSLTQSRQQFIPLISLSVFAVFAFFYFREVPTWRTVLAFVLIVAAVFLALPLTFSKPGAE